MDVRTITLDVQEFAVSQFQADELFANIHPSQLRMQSEYSLQHMAYVLRCSLKLPGTKLPKTLVASYPATWWDHVKARLGRKHRKMEVYREDVVVFPDIEIPPRATQVRVHAVYGLPQFSAN